MFEATTVFNNIEYELELSESIELPSGKGDIFGTISYETEDGKENTYDFSLSFDVENMMMRMRKNCRVFWKLNHCTVYRCNGGSI